jgi:hypothetical protein
MRFASDPTELIALPELSHVLHTDPGDRALDTVVPLNVALGDSYATVLLIAVDEYVYYRRRSWLDSYLSLRNAKEE